MSVRVLWKADHGIEVQLGVQAVFDPVRLRGQKKRGNALHILTSFGLNIHIDWSLANVFERTIDTACPVAETSKIVIDLPTDGAYTLSPESTEIQDGLAVYDVNKGECDTFHLFTMN